MISRRKEGGREKEGGSTVGGWMEGKKCVEGRE